MNHFYKDDLEDFLLSLSALYRDEPKRSDVSMTEISDPMVVVRQDPYSKKRTTYYVDMEGSLRPASDFKDDQQILIEGIHELGESWPFLCYPDLPFSAMQAIARFASTHNLAAYRLPLWKIARSPLREPKALIVALLLLHEGYSLPDRLEILDSTIAVLGAHYDALVDGVELEDDQDLLDVYGFHPNLKTKLLLVLSLL